MKTFQGFESIQVFSEEDGVMIAQGDDLVFIPKHLIKAIAKAIRDESKEAGQA